MLLINVFNYDTNQPIRDKDRDPPSLCISFSTELNYSFSIEGSMLYVIELSGVSLL